MAEIFEPLQRYLIRRVPVSAVDDLLSDTLLVVWRRLDDIPSGSQLPWAYGVARNVVGNHRRSVTRLHNLEHRLTLEPAAIDPGPDHLLDGDPDLESALQELSDEELELVRLWAWEGLEPREIARVMATSANAVSLRLSRIKRKLRDQIERQSSRSPGQIQGEQAQEM